MFFTGPTEDSVCNSFDLEFSRSYSEADSSPVVTDRAGFVMQSSQSCDSGLQLGDDVSLHMAPQSPQLKQLTSSESREENEKMQSVTKKLRRSKKRLAPGIPFVQESSSTDDLRSMHSVDSLQVHSMESPLDELAESPMVQHSLADSPAASDLIQSPKPSLSQSTRLNQSKGPSSKGTAEPSTGQSVVVPTFQSSQLVKSKRAGQNEKMRTTLSDDSVLESFDETSEGSSDVEFLKDFTASSKFSNKNLPRNVCEGAQQQSVNPYIVVSSDYQRDSRGCRGLDMNQGVRRRPPPLSQLHGTNFAEECKPTPDEHETAKMNWELNYSSSKAAAAFRMRMSSDSGNYNLDEPCQSADSVANSPESLFAPNCGESSGQQSRAEDDVRESLRSSRQHLSPTRRPLLRTNAVVESESEKLKQGMTATGSDLFPSQIKNLLQQSATGSDKQLPTRNVTAKASRTEHFHKQRTEQPSTGGWQRTTDKWNRGLPTYEEALQQKAKQQQLQQGSSCDQQKHLQGVKGRKHLENNEVLLSHCKSLDDVSTLVTEKRNDPATLQNRSPSHSSYLNYIAKVQNQTTVEVKETPTSVCSRTTEVKQVSLQKSRKQLYLGDGKKNETQQTLYKSRDECHTSSSSHDKYQAGAVKLFKSRYSSSSSALDGEECNTQEPSCRPRVTRKRVRNRHLRKRFSDPRMNTEKCSRGSELGRSKSDSCELCWNNARKQLQANLRSMEREHSKENIVSGDQLTTSKQTCLKEVRSAKSISTKVKVSDPSVSLRDVNRNHETNDRNANRKSLTVRNKDWHRELSEQYTESESFLSVSSPTGRIQLSYSPNRFGREVNKDVASGSSHALPCININLNVSVTISSDHSGTDHNGKDHSGKDHSGKDRTGAGLTTRASCQTESGSGSDNTATKRSDKSDSSSVSSHGFKSQIPRRIGLSASSVPVISIQGQRDTFSAMPLTADSSKISDSWFKEADNSRVKRGNIRPSCETISDFVDDAVLLNPANISWSVAKLKELYSDQHPSSGIKSPPVTSAPHSLSHSKSEDLAYRRPSALPKLSPTGNPLEKTRKLQADS